MSQENLEVVRKLYELFGRRDLGPAFPDYAHPEIELRVPPLYPDTPQVFHGREGVERWIAMIDEVAHLWEVERGRATSIRVYLNRTDALEAAGLRE